MTSNRRVRSRFFLLLLACLLVAALQGCAFMNRDNTPALNMVEEQLWPEATGWRIAVFPVVFPVGLVAVIVDAMVIHPATVIDDAAGDTGDVLWDNWEWDDHYVTECTILPWRAVVTPFVFIGDFLGRSFFDIPTRADRLRRQAESIENTEAARIEVKDSVNKASRLLAEGKPSEALDELLDAGAHPGFLLLDPDDDSELVPWYRSLVFKAAHLAGRYGEIDINCLNFALRDNRHDNDLDAIINEMQGSDRSVARWVAFMFRISVPTERRKSGAALNRALSDPDRMLRFAALSCIGSQSRLWGTVDLIPTLRRIAKEDPDPVIRAYAGFLGRQIIPTR